MLSNLKLCLRYIIHTLGYGSFLKFLEMMELKVSCDLVLMLIRVTQHQICSCCVSYCHSELFSLLVSDKGWSESRLGPFATRDPRFPLPGNMGVVIDKDEKTTPLNTKSLVDVLLEAPSDEAHKMEVIGCFLDNVAEIEESTDDITQV